MGKWRAAGTTEHVQSGHLHACQYFRRWSLQFVHPPTSPLLLLLGYLLLHPIGVWSVWVGWEVEPGDGLHPPKRGSPRHVPLMWLASSRCSHSLGSACMSGIPRPLANTLNGLGSSPCASKCRSMPFPPLQWLCEDGRNTSTSAGASSTFSALSPARIPSRSVMWSCWRRKLKKEKPKKRKSAKRNGKQSKSKRGWKEGRRARKAEEQAIKRDETQRKSSTRTRVQEARVDGEQPRPKKAQTEVEDKSEETQPNQSREKSRDEVIQ